jgi:hypothetical protein
MIRDDPMALSIQAVINAALIKRIGAGKELSRVVVRTAELLFQAIDLHQGNGQFAT